MRSDLLPSWSSQTARLPVKVKIKTEKKITVSIASVRVSNEGYFFPQRRLRRMRLNIDMVSRGKTFISVYSYLSATNGSTLVARRAGM